MNTKVTFYCTHLEQGQFRKLIFQQVLEGVTFADNREANDWLDDQINKLYNEFDLNLVFDWVLVGYTNTKESPSEAKELESVVGRLVFNKPRKKAVKKPKKIYDLERENKQPERKTYQSV
jgi:hypothetical protein